MHSLDPVGHVDDIRGMVHSLDQVSQIDIRSVVHSLDQVGQPS